jgi:hypothetical protein
LAELKAEVEASPQGVVLTTGERLRIAAGESRLKEKARERIAEKLRGAGLIAIPEVPQFQHEEVYVAQAGSPAELLFAALTHPSGDSLTRHVLPAVGIEAGHVVKTVALAEASDLLDELRARLEEAEDGQPRD